MRDRGRQVDLLVRKRVHGVVVQHELAEQPSLVDERDEGQRADALAGDDVTKGSQVGLGEDVGHEHRRWILVAHRPRRVALHGRAVPIGQAAPGLEAHDAVGVEDQQAGAPGAGGRQHGVDRCLVDLGGAARPADERGETPRHHQHLTGLELYDQGILRVAAGGQPLLRRSWSGQRKGQGKRADDGSKHSDLLVE